MDRGSLELISHYHSDTHLIKEHRIRVEIPGMSLFDKNEKEILGMALLEEKKVPKDTHPLATKLVAQGIVPAVEAVASPTDKNIFQVSFFRIRT